MEIKAVTAGELVNILSAVDEDAMIYIHESDTDEYVVRSFHVRRYNDGYVEVVLSKKNSFNSDIY